MDQFFYKSESHTGISTNLAKFYLIFLDLPTQASNGERNNRAHGLEQISNWANVPSLNCMSTYVLLSVNK